MATLRPTVHFAGTRALSSSNQFKTTVMVGDATDGPFVVPLIIRNRWPSRETSYGRARNRALEPRVARLVDFAHAALAQRCDDFIWTEACTGGEGQTLWIIQARGPGAPG